MEEEQQHDPLIVYVTRKPQASEPSMSSEDDPLYDRVKKPGEEEPMYTAEEEEPREEPVYAKVPECSDVSISGAGCMKCYPLDKSLSSR